MEYLHINKNTVDSKSNFLLLFIPIIVFFLTFALFVSLAGKNRQKVSTAGEPANVLGGESRTP